MRTTLSAYYQNKRWLFCALQICMNDNDIGIIAKYQRLIRIVSRDKTERTLSRERHSFTYCWAL